jgi:hypothetical protein
VDYRKEVEWWKGDRAKRDILTYYPLDSLILIDNLLAAIDKAREERDEARRSCCEFAAMVDSADTVLMYVDSNRFHEIAMRYMKSRGWDCFKEDGK